MGKRKVKEKNLGEIKEFGHCHKISNFVILLHSYNLILLIGICPQAIYVWLWLHLEFKK